MAGRAYKTLPSAFRKDSNNGGRGGKRSISDQNRASSRSSASPLNSEGLFSGLELKLGFANIISGGMNLIGHLRRKTPTTATATSSNSSSPSSTTSGAFWECQTQPHSTATMADVSELIEMTSFHSVPLAEGDLEHQSGRGHDFVCVASFNPTWCDLCRDLIWGLYDAGAMRCANCNLTCHEKCKSKVQLNCTAYERPASPPSSSSSSSASSLEMSTLANISTIMDEEASDDMDDEEGTLKGLDMDLLVASMNNTDLDDLEAASSLTEAPEDTTLVEIDEEEEDSQIIPPEQLQSAIMLYNDGFPPGQETFFEPAGTCKGFIRVRMNLSRPINVLPGQMATSVLNLTLDSNTDKSSDKPSLTSFYLPHETEKALCVTSVTTTHDVIRTLLAKFRIVDNPHKYVMYERRPFQRRRSSTGGDSTVTISGSIRSRATLGRINLRRLENAERPLMIALNNSLKDEQKIVFVLQENDPGEITWNEFTMPELKNFLLILDREEAWYKRKIHEKYEIIHQHLGKLAEQKRAEEEAAAAAAAEAKNA